MNGQAQTVGRLVRSRVWGLRVRAPRRTWRSGGPTSGLAAQRGVEGEARRRPVQRGGQRCRGGSGGGPTAAGTFLAGVRGHLGLSGLHPVRVRVIERQRLARGRREEGGEGSTREVEVVAASKKSQQAGERLEDQGRGRALLHGQQNTCAVSLTLP